MVLLDGKKVSEEIKIEQKERLEVLKSLCDFTPALAVILVGDNPASKVYVRNKKQLCVDVGIESQIYTFEVDESVDPTEIELSVIKTIEELNNDKCVVGILVQLPLPKGMNEQVVLNAIAPNKDVDGFLPINMGKLLKGETHTICKNSLGEVNTNGSSIVPCTPLGVIELLHRYNVEIEGKNCVVIGRSNIVGKPMALLMLKENATVTIAHSKTKNLKEICRNADILICAMGKAKFITADYIKDGAVVVDVGMNRDENGKLCGDVDFENVKDKVSMITPVPGGVGPMTVCMLIKNCVDNCAEIYHNNVTNLSLMLEEVKSYVESKPKMDELVFVESFCKKFGMPREEALAKIRELRRELKERK